MMPRTKRITPIATTLSPLTLTSTAHVRIAPKAIKTNPMATPITADIPAWTRRKLLAREQDVRAGNP